MRNVEPKVYLIAKTRVEGSEAQKWVSDLGAPQFPVFDGSTCGEKLVQLCGKRCYMSFVAGLNPNVQRVRDDMKEFIDNILKVGHGSVLEHVSFSFALENVSRVFTGEMNRHRAGMAISEGSMRFIRFDDIPYWEPTSIQRVNFDGIDIPGHLKDAMEYDAAAHDVLERKKERTRKVFADAFRSAEGYYKILMDIWKEELSPDSKFKDKKNVTSMMRRIIPMGVASGGVWTGNLRALRHIFTMRCDAAAEEEILLVASMMLEKMREVEPLFFGDFERNIDGYWRPKYTKV